jgi:hypothetical protein
MRLVIKAPGAGKNRGEVPDLDSDNGGGDLKAVFSTGYRAVQVPGCLMIFIRLQCRGIVIAGISENRLTRV